MGRDAGADETGRAWAAAREEGQRSVLLPGPAGSRGAGGERVWGGAARKAPLAWRAGQGLRGPGGQGSQPQWAVPGAWTLDSG